MPPPGKARKSSGVHPTFRKQPHGPVRPDNRTSASSFAGKSTYPGVSQRVQLPFRPLCGRFSLIVLIDTPKYYARLNRAKQNSKLYYLCPFFFFPKRLKFRIAPRPLITSHPYAIAGVAGFHPGFHRGAKPPVIGSSQLERRLKPVPHKNVGGSRIDRGPKIPRDMNPSGRLLDSTAAKKSRARRIKAVTQASSIMKRDLLLNQHRKCLIPFQCCTEFGLICKNSQVDSIVYADIVFGGATPNKHYRLVTQSSEHMLIYSTGRV